MSFARGAANQPVIEVDGKLQFRLPGTPLFPALSDDTILKPTLQWLIESSQSNKFNAELHYITGGMSWISDYNIIASPQGDVLDLIGWVTIDNQSGKTFEDTNIKLMAGDVNKIQSTERRLAQLDGYNIGSTQPQSAVQEKTFDEYHLYTLRRSTTLHDRESKQVEFMRASGVKSKRIYVYDGAKINWSRYRGRSLDSVRGDRNYGTQSNPKIWVMREFENTEKNNLGMPLPKGNVRFYQQDEDGSLEFTGENIIDHTPRDETIRVYTGNAFDLVGERKRTNYDYESSKYCLEESFEIKLRNHKKEEVKVKVVEHMYRWINWEILEKSDDYLKTDSQAIEFAVPLKPGEEKTISYKVHYTW